MTTNEKVLATSAITDEDLCCVASATAFMLVSEGTWDEEQFNRWFVIKCSEYFGIGVRVTKSGLLG